MIEISSDDESSGSDTSGDDSYDDKSYVDEPSDDESSDEQQKHGPGHPSAPMSVSRRTPSTEEASTCQPGQVSAPNDTTRNKNAAPATDAASIVEHKAARPDHGSQRDPRPFAEPCGTMSNDNNLECLSHDERDKFRPPHDIWEPHRAAPSQAVGTRQELDGRYRSASDDGHGGGGQTSGSAYRHPPVPDETGKRASPVVLDHQHIREPKPADAEYLGSPSAASKHRMEKQHQPGNNPLSQHRNCSVDSNQTKQDDSQLPGGKEEKGIGSSAATPQTRESGASISRSPEAISNDGIPADAGASVQPSSSQDRVSPQQSPGRRPYSGTDVGDDHKPVEDSTSEHGGGDTTQPPRKRHRDTSTPAVGQPAPKRQANLASSQPRRSQRQTSRYVSSQSQPRNPKLRSTRAVSKTKKGQGEYFDVKRIVGVEVRYLVEWEGWGPRHITQEPPEHFERCPEVLQEFHESTGSVDEWIARRLPGLRLRSTEAHRSAP